MKKVEVLLRDRCLFMVKRANTSKRDGITANLDRPGGSTSQIKATCRAVSATFNSGVNPEVMIDQLSNIRCLSTAVARKSNLEIEVLSYSDAIDQDAMGSEEKKSLIPFSQTCEVCNMPMLAGSQRHGLRVLRQ